MKKLILVFVLLLSFISFSAAEQKIEFKLSGGVERPPLNSGSKSNNEPYIGYNEYQLKQETKYGDIKLVCSGDGWESFALDTTAVTVICAYSDLLKQAVSKIKKGLLRGDFTDEISKGKKRYSRTVKWNSSGLYKSSTITIILENDN